MGKGRVTQFGRRAACLLGAASMALTMVVMAPAAPAWGSSSDTVDISSVALLKSFRDAVNAGNTYAGKTVRLSRDLTLSGAWTPIGTSAHPFCGVFDGGDHAIAGMQVNGSSDLGFFGCVGVGGKIENLRITNGDNGSDPSSVTAASDSQVVRNVGSIAGYAFGTPGGSAIENCESAAAVNVTSSLKPAKAKSGQFTPEGEAAEGSKASLSAGASDGGIAVERIGGVVGYSAAGISNTSYSGALSVSTHESPMDSTAVYVGSTIGGLAGQVGGYTTTREVEGAERALTIAHYPKAGGGYAQEAAVVSVVENCANTGMLTVTADAKGGRDRFGVDVSAAFVNVGGIVGNSFGDVKNCTNSCDVNARTSAATGGIVGTLRGTTYTGTSIVLNDAGEQFSCEKNGSSYSYKKTSEAPTASIERCTNRASVTGLAQVGGILGEGGTHTRVAFCKNVKNGNAKQAVTGTRWNKPMPAGIAGMTHGDVTHCYNRVDVVTEAGAGYYAAGLVGMLARYTVSAGNAADSPIPQMDACYSTGTVQANGPYRQAGVCGENDGSIHDCYMLDGSVLNVKDADAEQPYRPMVATNEGSVAKSVGVATAAAMKSKSFCGEVNASTSLTEFRADEDFLPDIADEDRALNDGYPVFGYERTAVESDADRAAKVQLNNSGLSAAGYGRASYQADGNPVPTLNVSYRSSKLVQGADYYVIPDASAADAKGRCKSISEIGTADLEAHIVGIGDYFTGDTSEGSLFTAPYHVEKGQFSSCSAAIASKDFDYLAHYPTKADITITDAAGNVVPDDQYSIPADPGTWAHYHVTYANKAHDKKSHVGYELKIAAGKNSNYEGSLYGYFQIKKADLFRDEKTKFAGFEVAGQKWSWAGSRIVNAKVVGGYLYRTDAAGKQEKGMQVVYTGEPIKPKALQLQYRDGDGKLRTLAEGTDYRVIYGDPGRDDLISKDVDSNTNVARGDGAAGTRPCVTVRYVPGDSHDFLNYQNFFFDIVKADLSDSEQTTVKANGDLDASSVIVRGSTGAKISKANYTVKRTVSGDKVKLVIRGKENLKGTRTLEAKLASANKGGLTYQAAGSGTALVVKARADVKTAAIPSTVKIGGRKLKVTAVAAKAFTKCRKLKKVTIGSNVKAIGSRAFYGCKKLKSVTIKTSKLGKKSIGTQAFAKISSNAKVKAPKAKVKTYKKYLRKAGLPKKAVVGK